MRGRHLLVLITVLVVVVVVAAVVLADLPVFTWARGLDAWVTANHGLAAGLLFLICACWSLILPTMLPTLLGGFWFGLLAGSVIIYAATTAACVIAFLASRYCFHDSAQRWINDSRRLQLLQQALIADGWRTILLMRLSPIVPFSVQNWCYGASTISFWTCLGATLVGKLPNTVLTVAAGALARSGLDPDQARSGTGRIGLLVALVATILLLWSMARTARRALRPIDDVEVATSG